MPTRIPKLTKSPKVSPKNRRQSKRKHTETNFKEEAQDEQQRSKIPRKKIQRNISAASSSNKIGEVSVKMTTLEDLKTMITKLSVDQQSARQVADESLDNLKKIQTEITQINSKVDRHDQEITHLANSQNITNKEILQLKSKVNYFEQREIDNNLQITGFKVIPKEAEISQICSLLNFSTNSILHFNAWQMTPRPDNPVANRREQEIKLIIRFSTKERQMEFREAARKHGPIYAAQLLEGAHVQGPSLSQSATTNRDVLKVTNCYSACNRKINWIQSIE